MITEFKTPHKSLSDSSSATPDTVKHLKTISIFSNSNTKSASPISEKRYTHENNIFEKSDEAGSDAENFPKVNKLLNYNIESLGISDSHRQKSLVRLDDILDSLKPREFDKYPKKSHSDLGISHQRNVSDADSVVYMGSDEEKYMREFRGQPFAFGENRESMPMLESTPCSAYCRYCKVEVHTSVELHNTKVSQSVIKVISSVFSCCSLPTWLGTTRVHKCPNCKLVIARCR